MNRARYCTLLALGLIFLGVVHIISIFFWTSAAGGSEGLQPKFQFSRVLYSSSKRASHLTFVREFFLPRELKRREELLTSIRATVEGNKGCRFVFVVQELPHESLLLLKEYVPLDSLVVHESIGQILYSTFFEVARHYSGTFVVSTADVSIANVSAVLFSCAGYRGKFFVVSRRDKYPDPKSPYNPGSCRGYQAITSADVYIGQSDMITNDVLKNLLFPGFYWGVDNLIPYVFSRQKLQVFNLCPYLDVVHLHQTRDKGSDRSRIRLNHPFNDLGVIQSFTKCKISEIRDPGR